MATAVGAAGRKRDCPTGRRRPSDRRRPECLPEQACPWPRSPSSPQRKPSPGGKKNGGLLGRGEKDGERSSGRLGPSRSPHPVSSPTPYGRVPLPSSGHHGTPSMPLDPLPPAPMPPPVRAAMARPAQQLDVASALPPKAGVGPMVDRDRRRASTVQDQRPPAPGAAPVARHEPPPPPRPPHRRSEIQLIQQRVPPTHAHAPSSGPGRSAQSAPIARKATASSGAARGRRPAEILNDGGRFRSSAPNRSDPPHSPVTPEVAGLSPVAPVPPVRTSCTYAVFRPAKSIA